MKVSYNWIKEYIDVNLSVNELADLLTDIGLEVEGIHQFESVKGGLTGLVVGYVSSSKQHPNADKLKVTQVDIGDGELKQIVCGAPNVEEGQKVVVAPVGSVLYGANEEPFKIKRVKIRGEESLGMICAEDEIGLGNNHEGIMVLDNNVEVGTPIKTLFNVEEDIIFEIGLTPNRADAFSHYGVARDLYAALKYRNDFKGKLKSIEAPQLTPKALNNGFEVKVENRKACPVYCGLIIKGLEVKESPSWLKNKIEAIGFRSINNIVDITNYVMNDLGQPLHAFDLNEVGSQIVVRNANKGDVFLALDEQEYKLSSEDLMICNAQEGMCIAGVFGGVKSGVKHHTTAIFLESAYFAPTTIRRTSTNLGLRTDAASHFEKGVDPQITIVALKRAAKMILELAGGEISSPIFDVRSEEVEKQELEINIERINRHIGANIPKEDVLEILNLLEIEVLEEQGAILKIAVPPYRVDVKREADITEEIVRIYGLNNVALPEKLNTSIVSDSLDESNNRIVNKIADRLVGLGFNEIMTNSITKSRYYPQNKNLIKLLNSINTELDVLRPDMIVTGLESLQHNLNRKNTKCKFFEFGKSYAIEDNLNVETEHLCLFVTGDRASETWQMKAQQTDFYYIKSVVEEILASVNLSNYVLKESNSDHFDSGMDYCIGESAVAQIGRVSRQMLSNVDIKQPVFYAQFNWALVLKLFREIKITYSEVSKFPKVRRDLALLLNNSVKFQDIKQLADKVDKKRIKEVNLFDVYKDEKLGEDKKSYAVSFLLQDNKKTLTDKEIDRIMNKLIGLYQKELKAEVR